MFATLAGAYPASRTLVHPTTGDWDDLVRAAIADQEAAGLEPLTDGQVRWADPFLPFLDGLGGLGGGAAPAASRPAWAAPITVGDWRFAAGCTTRAVKQSVAGPYSLGRVALSGVGAAERERLTIGLAEALGREISALADAGCPLVQVEEPGAVAIGADEAERALFRAAQDRLTDGLTGLHLSLAITGGSADGAGPETIFRAPYSSYLFDLLAGPDNWRLIALAPAERGIVCGAADARRGLPDHREILLWAAHYAASTQGRGLERVGLATSDSMAGLSPDAARAKIVVLGEAARLASMEPSTDLAAALDPRAIDIRSAAHGRYDRPLRAGTSRSAAPVEDPPGGDDGGSHA